MQGRFVEDYHARPHSETGQPPLTSATSPPAPAGTATGLEQTPALPPTAPAPPAHRLRTYATD